MCSFLNFLICMGLVLSVHAASPDLSPELERICSLKVLLRNIEDKSEWDVSAGEVRKEFLKLACKYQNSTSPTDQDLAPFCLIEAASLDQANNSSLIEGTKDVAQAYLSDSAGYDFGKMSSFLAKVKETDTFRCVFSVDGGGIRGLIPALYFQWIEDELGHTVINAADFFAGTSVGGIIASGFNCPCRLTAKEMVKLFSEKGGRIFPHTQGLIDTISAPFRFVGETFVYSRYRPEPLQGLMEEYFGDSWLADSAKPLLVTAIDTTSEYTPAREFFFDSVAAKKGEHAENYRFRDIARATSAATTYFPAADILNYDSTPRRFVDAGLTLNNPAYYAYIRAKGLYPEDKIVVFSFGTGHALRSRTIPADAGTARSAKPLINNMMEMNSEQTHFRFAQPEVLREGDSYVRVQCELDREIDLDKISEENLAYLMDVAKSQSTEIKLIADFLRENNKRRLS